jgi:hypothetical protein
MRTWLLAFVFAISALFASDRLSAATLSHTSATVIASQIDDLLAKERDGSEVVKTCDDETFLRRATLDLLGEQPSPEAITAFALNRDPNKRQLAIEKMLADPHYGQNWGRYWRDVILYRRTDERALAVAIPATVYLTEQLNHNTPWDKVASSLITAKGDIAENGATALIVSQWADPNGIASEASRIFLGMQMQCAQCHNHPYDRWKREQFHELAAFFPRIGIRPQPAELGRDFKVVSLDHPSGLRAPGVMEETKTEHYMPDLNDPKDEGKLMTPIFFATGQKLSLGTSDDDRRAALAKWLTSPSDPWFAKALVNRLWAELVGEGFNDPVDDMGPDHPASSGAALDQLAKEFASNHYDLKWLMQTIMGTQAYQSASHTRVPGAEGMVGQSCPQRLRADQLFNQLTAALGIDEEAMMANIKNRGGKPGRQFFQGPRGQVVKLFGYDPSTKRDEVTSSIPQTLFLMNGQEVNRPLAARRGEVGIGKLVSQTKDDEQVATDIYLRCLAREPKEPELKVCLDHVKQSGSRQQAFEDITWALVNSAEFLHRK